MTRKRKSNSLSLSYKSIRLHGSVLVVATSKTSIHYEKIYLACVNLSTHGNMYIKIRGAIWSKKDILALGYPVGWKDGSRKLDSFSLIFGSSRDFNSYLDSVMMLT